VSIGSGGWRWREEDGEIGGVAGCAEASCKKAMLEDGFRESVHCLKFFASLKILRPNVYRAN
jgi:hypothetical protein